MTLQLPCTLHTCAAVGGLPIASQPRVSASLHNLEYFFTLSHSLPLHDSHLNTGLLIAKIQANLTWNKANKMVDKIQPYTEYGHVLQDSLVLASEFRVSMFIHVKHVSNSVAHFLAKCSKSSNELQV